MRREGAPACARGQVHAGCPSGGGSGFGFGVRVPLHRAVNACVRTRGRCDVSVWRAVLVSLGVCVPACCAWVSVGTCGVETLCPKCVTALRQETGVWTGSWACCVHSRLQVQWGEWRRVRASPWSPNQQGPCTEALEEGNREAISRPLGCPYILSSSLRAPLLPGLLAARVVAVHLGVTILLDFKCPPRRGVEAWGRGGSGLRQRFGK